MHIELDAVGTLLPGEAKGLHRVLPRAARGTAMADDQRGRKRHRRSVFALRLQNGRSDPLQRVLARS